jgi:hypothetical protein
MLEAQNQIRKGRVMQNRDSVIENIKALLSKTTANGCSEEEMLSALAKARAWIDTHEISDEELQHSREEKVALHDESGADIHDSNRIKWQLPSGVAEFCSVRIYRDRQKAGLSFVGYKSDIEYATWLIDQLADFVHTALFDFLLDHDCLAPKDKKEALRGFVIGCIERICDRMIAMCNQSKGARTANGKELVVIRDRAIKGFLKAEGINLRCGGSSAAFSDGARAAGQSAGDRASFARPVSGAGAALRLGSK